MFEKNNNEKLNTKRPLSFKKAKMACLGFEPVTAIGRHRRIHRATVAPTNIYKNGPSPASFCLFLVFFKQTSIQLYNKLM